MKKKRIIPWWNTALKKNRRLNTQRIKCIKQYGDGPDKIQGLQKDKAKN
jgi:hypothetical protein